MRLPEAYSPVDVVLGTDGSVLHSRVEDVRQPDTILMGLPTDGSRTFPLSAGTEILLRWVTMRGLTQGSGVVGATTGERIPVLVVKLTSNEILQRRDHVRVESVVEFQLRQRGSAPMRSLTVDLSGGGMRASAPIELEADEIVEIALFLPEQKPVDLDARVLRRNEDGTYAFRFEEIEAADQERLIQFVFAAHRREFVALRRIAS